MRTAYWQSLTALLVALGGTPLSAQTLVGAPPQPTSGDCSRATTLLSSGDITNDAEQGWARSLAGYCSPNTVWAYAEGMKRRRALALSPGMRWYFDPAVASNMVLDAALTIARDPAASEAARVLSLRTLRVALAGGRVAYEEMVGTGESDACMPGVAGQSPDRPGAWPADAADRIRTVVAPMERQPLSPSLRSAAHCVMNEWRFTRGLPVQVLHPADGYSLAIAHVCESTFRITSSSPYPLSVQVAAGAGAPPAEHVTRGGGAPGSPVTTDVVSAATTVRLLFDGALVSEAARGGAACP